MCASCKRDVRPPGLATAEAIHDAAAALVEAGWLLPPAGSGGQAGRLKAAYPGAGRQAARRLTSRRQLTPGSSAPPATGHCAEEFDFIPGNASAAGAPAAVEDPAPAPRVGPPVAAAHGAAQHRQHANRPRRPRRRPLFLLHVSPPRKLPLGTRRRPARSGGIAADAQQRRGRAEAQEGGRDAPPRHRREDRPLRQG